MGAINNPFAERKKEKYEDAFEHFLSSKYTINEEIDEEQVEEEESFEDVSLDEGEGNGFENYLTGLFDTIDLGDEYEEGPQSYTFEKIEWADEDLYGDEAAMFEPAHNHIKSKGEIKLTDPTSGIPLTFRTEGEDIVVDFNTEDF